MYAGLAGSVVVASLLILLAGVFTGLYRVDNSVKELGRILLIDPKEDSVASETDTALFERAVFRIFIIENAVQQFRIGNSGQNFLQQALCPLYLRSSSIVGSKRQACKALLVHPAYHRADTRVRQDSISRT